MRLSETEWRVMNVLWDHGPRSARQVLDEVGDATEWAYTTVKTILSRLAEKGAVSVSMRGNASVYAPEVTRDDARRSALRGLLDRAFDGTFGSLIHHLVEDETLTAGDRRELRTLLEEDRRARGKEPRT